jgi:transglutaminase-like putative cysteine protease
VPGRPQQQALLDSVPRGAQPTVDMPVMPNRAQQRRTAYIVRVVPGVRTQQETLAAGLGSCRDSAWLLVYDRLADIFCRVPLLGGGVPAVLASLTGRRTIRSAVSRLLRRSDRGAVQHVWIQEG